MSTSKERIPYMPLLAAAAAFAAGIAGVALLRRASAPKGAVAEQPRARRISIDATDPVEVASDDSFPASDPPATSPTTVGSRRGAAEYNR